jgi:hypothetical protein
VQENEKKTKKRDQNANKEIILMVIEERIAVLMDLHKIK